MPFSIVLSMPSVHRTGDRWLTTALCLRLVVVLQCIGVAGRYVFSPSESESDVYGWLYFDHEWPEPLAQAIDDWGAIGCCIAAGMLLLCPLVGRWVRPSSTSVHHEQRSEPSGVRLLECLAGCYASIWVLMIALTHMVRGDVYAELSLGEYAVRIVAPLALLLVTARPPRLKTALFLMIVAAAATFAVHGYKAAQAYGPFVDLILLSDMRWTGLMFDQTPTEKALIAIGIVDILVAALLLVFRSRYVAFYMFVWGLVTAASRMTAFGPASWPETVIRSANWGVPLAIFLLLSARRVDHSAAEFSSPKSADNLSNSKSESTSPTR